MNQKGYVNIILVIFVVILAGVVGYLVLIKKPALPTANQTQFTNTSLPQQTSPATSLTPTPKPEIKPDKTTNWKIFQLTGYNGYEFKYPQEFILLTGDELSNPQFAEYVADFTVKGGGPQALVYLPDNVYPNTNFVRAYFSASRNGVIANLSDCKKVKWPNGQIEELKNTQKINNITFYKGSYGGVALGTETEYRVYRAFGGSGGDGCYEIVLSLSNRTPTGYEGKMIDKNEIWKKLESILSTFKFI